jgi:sterol desaturase/sphingolipid hydroxylase (fatty acid hydroxylase superfamily)
VLEQFRVFPEYRIQPGKWPKNAEYVKTLLNIFQNYILVILPMCFIAPPVLEYVGITAYGPLPSLSRLAVDLVFCMLIEDIFQYAFHRMLHLPSLYPLIHKVHHEWTTPFAMAASYAHPAEVFILALAAFAGPLMCRPHLCSFFLWLLVRQMDAVKTHSGWAWPGVDHVLRHVPFYEGAVFHDFHHRSFIFNYASRFSFIDIFFGTFKVTIACFSKRSLTFKRCRTIRWPRRRPRSRLPTRALRA